MSKQISIPSIINAIHNGIKSAWNDHYSWSGGLWLKSAPEYLLTTYIAKSLGELNGPKFITLEENPDEILTLAGGRGRGRLAKDIRSDGSMDILLWWGNDTPRAIIEVKKDVYSFSKLQEDVKRIKGILIKESTFQFGVIAIYTDIKDNTRKNAKDLMSDRLETLRKAVSRYDGEIVPGEISFDEKNGCAWVSVIMVFR